MKPVTPLLILTLATGLLAAPAYAQDALPGLRQFDIDGNGSLSRDEARAAASSRFALLDADHDGYVSQDEFIGARLALFDQADADADGQVTRSEVRARVLDGVLAARSR